MRPVNKILVVGVFVLVQISFPAQSQPVIVIDPGHGGMDLGAVGMNGVKEKELVLELAREILTLSEEKDGLDIYLTRYKDTLVSLGERARLGRSLKADLFLSLHCNDAENPSARGAEVFVVPPPIRDIEGNSEKSILLARQLVSEMNKKLGLHSRGVNFANFQVLRESLAFSPAILVELGFLSNADEALYFSQRKSLKGVASLIIEILTKHFEL